MLGLINISEAMSIALHACAYFADSPAQRHTTRLVSEHFGFSMHHCAKVVQQLVQAGLLETGRGPSGGAKLTRTPEAINLLEIYEAIGGKTQIQGCLLKPDICAGDGCLLGKLLREENTRLTNLLQSYTLKDIAQSFTLNTPD